MEFSLKFRITCAIFFVFSGFWAKESFSTPVLTVYVYSSFTSKWGAGDFLKQEFEKQCQCSVRWVSLTDGLGLLGQMRLEGKNLKADVIMGLDTTLLDGAKATGLLANISHEKLGETDLPVPVETDYFYPFDYGFYAFMYDSRKVKPFNTFDELLEKAPPKSIIIEDARISTPGQGLLFWMYARYGEKANEYIAKLKPKILTVTKGWSEAYGLFLKGEAPIVLSYTLSEGYHKMIEKVDHYRAMFFSDGHLVQIEGAVVNKHSLQYKLAIEWLKFLRTDKAQIHIATRNYMYPVTSSAMKKIPEKLLEVARPSKLLNLEQNTILQNRAAWINNWTNTLAN